MSDRKKVFLFCAGYFVEYLVRHCYAAALVEIIADLQVTRSLASIAVTGAFITYGLGQFVSGYLGDRLPPQRLVLLGIASTSVINILIGLIPDIRFMNIAWIVSGFFHSLFWAPLLRLISGSFPDSRDFRRAVGRVVQSGYAGTIAIYLIASWFVAAFRWQAVFLFTGAGGLAFAAVWLFSARSLSSGAGRRTGAEPVSPAPAKLAARTWVRAGMIPILLVVMGVGCLRDGIATWMPTYLADIFHFSSSISILTSVVLPVFAILAVEAASAVAKKSGNEVFNTMLTMFCAAALGAILFLSYGRLAAWDLFCISLIVWFLRGASFFLTGLLPRRFEKYGRISLVSGIINGMLYVGSAVATYVLGAVADRYGWSVNIAVWALIALSGAVLCLVALRGWRAFCGGEPGKKNTSDAP